MHFSLHLQSEVCFFLVRFTVSRLRTWSSVWLDSRIFMYAASVSCTVLSYSFRACVLRTSDSLIFCRRSVRSESSFWILPLSSSSFMICRLSSSRFDLLLHVLQERH